MGRRPQRTVDDALMAFWRVTERNDGLPPTVRELQEEMGLKSVSNGAWWMGRLEEEGLIYIPSALRTTTRYGRDRVRRLTSAGFARGETLARLSLAQAR